MRKHGCDRGFGTIGNIGVRYARLLTVRILILLQHLIFTVKYR